MPAPLRVLILEDSPTEAELMVHHLREAGYEPDWRRVETEPDYLSYLDPSLDLVLLDYTLPNFTGPRALQRLRDRGWDVPAIVVTGTVSEEAALDCLRLGANDYVLKDRPARLGAAVRSALEQRGLRRERTVVAADLALRTQQLQAVRAITLEIARETNLAPLLVRAATPGGEDGGGAAPLPSLAPESSRYLELQVADTGAGIRAEDLPRLFTEFTQLETTKDQRHEGTGLGLALTKRLIELHGGRIWAESDGEEKGSTFTLLLPIVQVA